MTQPNFNNCDAVKFEPNDLLEVPFNPGSDADDDSSFASLTTSQQQALEWLMSGGTITEAAELVGVKRQTVSRWVNHHFEFSHLYRQWQEQVRTGAEARLLGLADAAVNNLMAAVIEGKDVKASQFVLKLMGVMGRKTG